MGLQTCSEENIYSQMMCNWETLWEVTTSALVSLNARIIFIHIIGRRHKNSQWYLCDRAIHQLGRKRFFSLSLMKLNMGTSNACDCSYNLLFLSCPRLSVICCLNNHLYKSLCTVIGSITQDNWWTDSITQDFFLKMNERKNKTIATWRNVCLEIESSTIN